MLGVMRIYLPPEQGESEALAEELLSSYLVCDGTDAL